MPAGGEESRLRRHASAEPVLIRTRYIDIPENPHT